jgi:hypothetical protein
LHETYSRRSHLHYEGYSELGDFDISIQRL